MSGLFDTPKQTFLGSGATRLDMDTDVIKARLCDKTVDLATIDYSATSMTPIPQGTGGGGTTDQTLTSPAFVLNGGTRGATTAPATCAFDAADATWTAVTQVSSKTVGAIVIYKFVTNDAGSMPVCLIDGFTAVVPNGGNITAVFDSGNNRIFAI